MLPDDGKRQSMSVIIINPPLWKMNVDEPWRCEVLLIHMFVGRSNIDTAAPAAKGVKTPNRKQTRQEIIEALQYLYHIDFSWDFFVVIGRSSSVIEEDRWVAVLYNGISRFYCQWCRQISWDQTVLDEDNEETMARMTCFFSSLKSFLHRIQQLIDWYILAHDVADGISSIYHLLSQCANIAMFGCT